MRVGRIPGGVIAAAALAYALANVVSNMWLLPSSSLAAIKTSTGGIVTGTLLGEILGIALVGPVLWLGGVRVRDLGLHRRDLPAGLAAYVFLFALTQLALIAAALSAGTELQPGAALVAPVGVTFGLVSGQVFGNALVEEAFYRGFVFRQLALRWPAWKAALAAALIFALSHLPNRLVFGQRSGLPLPLDLAGLFAWAVFYAYVYWRCENLFIVIAMHALWNIPVPLVAAPGPPQVYFLIPLALLVVWLELTARRRAARASARAA